MVSFPSNWAAGAAFPALGNSPTLHPTASNTLTIAQRAPSGAGAAARTMSAKSTLPEEPVGVRNTAKAFVLSFSVASDGAGDSNARLRRGTPTDAGRIRRINYGGGSGSPIDGYLGTAANGPGRRYTLGPGYHPGYGRTAAHAGTDAGSYSYADGPTDPGPGTHGDPGPHGHAAADSYAPAAYSDAHAGAAESHQPFPGTDRAHRRQ